jgi:hypothetical protein
MLHHVELFLKALEVYKPQKQGPFCKLVFFDIFFVKTRNQVLTLLQLTTYY